VSERHVDNQTDGAPEADQVAPEADQVAPEADQVAPEADEAGGATTDPAERWLRTLPRLADHKLRVAHAASQFQQLSAGEIARGLNHVCQLAEQSHAIARQVVGAFVPTIVDTEMLDKVWSVRTTASVGALMSATRLLRASTPEGHGLDQSERSSTRGVLQNDAGKPLSLGERRALARRPSRATLDKLMRDPHPMVAAIVLKNPRITEDDVVRMAAYRPSMARVAVEIAKSWSRSSRVRMALVLNPGVPTALTVPLLPLLVRPELGEITRAADLPAVVRATAREHFELRPPMPTAEEPRRKH
jgi:hypothetical protein